MDYPMIIYHIHYYPTEDVHLIWVFGMVDTSHTPALGVMTVVGCSYSSSAVCSTWIDHDKWAAYNQVQHLLPVAQHNHSIEFVNPITDVHTQNMESYWNRVKSRG